MNHDNCRDAVRVLVTVPPGRSWILVDACIAPLVKALNRAGSIGTVASCCGHGRHPGNIMLADGRELAIVGPGDDELIAFRATREVVELLDALVKQGSDPSRTEAICRAVIEYATRYHT